MKRQVYVLLWAFFMIFLLGAVSRGQSNFGSITGTVRDPSGAVIPGAEIRVTNEGTGAVRQSTSDSAGVFNVPDLDNGRYRLDVSAKGFSTYERRPLDLSANQILNLSVELTVGTTATVVQVQAVAPTIATATNDISGEMGNNAIAELPMTFRHDGGSGGIYSLVTLTAGAVYQQGAGGPLVQGVRLIGGTLPTMDGIAVMPYLQGAGPVQPSMDSIQEVKVERINAPAEFTTPANFQIVTGGGTNAYHGSAYWDWNGDALNARNVFSAKVPFRVYNNFATHVGGPIKKDKLFFFADYEGSRESATAVVTESVPLAAWRTGNFSSLSTQLKNPFTGQPFSGNQIPATLLNNASGTVSQNIQSYAYPLPNAGTPGAIANNWTEQAPSVTGFTRYNDLTGRVDYNLSSRDAMFARVSWRHLPLLDIGIPYPLERIQLRKAQSGAYSWSHTFSPAVLNEFRFGATFHDNHYTGNVVGSTLMSQFGIQGISTTGIKTAPDFNITGVTPWNPGTSSFTYQDNAETDFEWIDNLSWTRGRHLMKFGFDAVRDRLGGDNFGATVYGEYDFTGVYTGSGYADFLLGIPQTVEVAVPNPERDLRGTLYGLFAQDQFKVNPSLTLNYGVRWELEGPYHSKSGIIYSFDPADGALVVPNLGLNIINPDFPKNLPIVGATQVGFPNPSLLNFNKGNIVPRIGFAYKLFGSDKTVLRGGYGIYTNLVYAGLDRYNLAGGPFSGSVQYINAINNGVALFSFPSPFLPSGTTSTQSVTGVNPNLKTPYTQQWNLTVERQVKEYGIRVSYIGSRTDQLIYVRNLNEPPPSLTPFSTSERPYSLYSTISYLDSGGNEFYNSLEVEVRKKYGRNLTMDAAWTWAKDLTDTEDDGGGGGVVTGQTLQNQFNRAIEKSNNINVAPNRFYAYWTYILPVGEGQPLLSKARGAVQQVLGGWRTTWSVVTQSGQWFTPSFSGYDPSNTGVFGGIPDRVPGVPLYPANRSVNDWFNANAFSIPGCPNSTPVCTNPVNIGRFGTSGENILEGPSLFSLDFGLFKYFTLNEHMRLQFIMTMANAFNHPNYGNPASNISSTGTVGVSSSEVTPQEVEPAPREIDFGLRLTF